ncbi:TIGR03619 family F420-dependent LLM class oxidoreductase [Iamia majanohamensis]|uniref:TIGR03619 family F420-dependent LLM class oxidoreductase n=1 Tax=Iamia majanohamensis TaxID=467976 RepID=A0AAE9Y778_9ACTN|nr:TIGR03619 family F420-dependent LLM class oxidoreductase [Iamia majanohamensis]WCO65579.1 TIGR03619 family F420-dependent LLM class oxidoreductase [Iamia majanohamensis]
MRFTIGMAYGPPEHYVPVARAADALGYWGIACSDHVLNLETLSTPYPYTEDGERRWPLMTPWLDPWVAIGAMGSATERLRFTTNVYVLPMRNPFTVAKMVSTASVLTGGRVALGVGMGWCEEEFDLLEQPFRKRGRRADEALELIAKAWTGEMVEHHGEFYDVPHFEMNPPPPGPVPVFVGGLSEPALRRAARHDGWISDLASTEETAASCRRLAELREEAGRADAPFTVMASLNDAADAEGFARAGEVGVTDILTMPWAYYHGFTDDLEAKVDGLERFAAEVLSAFPDPHAPSSS